MVIKKMTLKKKAVNDEGIETYLGFLESVDFFVSHVPKIIFGIYCT